VAHNLARRGVFSSASHGRAILARVARPSIPADRNEPEPAPLALIADCVAIAFALLCATGWPFAWIAVACR
jgi:hypothetical protein